MNLKYYTKQVVFQEVPDEVSLSFSIAGCPHNCNGCSWKNTLSSLSTTELTDEKYEKMLNHYKGLATCVLFLGGEWNKEDLQKKLSLAKSFGFKTCLYTGLEMNQIDESILTDLDYIKVGPYVEQLGGLCSKNTNQKFIDLKNKEVLNNRFIREI